METIKYKASGGIILIEKFDLLPIDAEITRRASQSALQKEPVFTKHAEQIDAKNAHLAKVREAQGNINKLAKFVTDSEKLFPALNEDEKPNALADIERSNEAIKSWNRKLIQAQKKVDGCDTDLDKTGRELVEKEKELKQSNAIYCHPRKNEVIPTKEQLEQYKTMFEGKGPNEQVKIQVKFVDKIVVQDPTNGDVLAPIPELTGEPSIIADFTGCQYFWKTVNTWNQTEVISELGQTKTDMGAPVDAIERKDLTPEQAEEIRIQGLTVEAKATEKQAELDRVLAESVNMRSGLEIQGKTTTQAKNEATTWYNEQVALIDAKYA